MRFIGNLKMIINMGFLFYFLANFYLMFHTSDSTEIVNTVWQDFKLKINNN